MSVSVNKASSLPAVSLPEHWDDAVRQAWKAAWQPGQEAIAQEAARRVNGWTGPELAFLVDPALPGTLPSALFATKLGAAPSLAQQAEFSVQTQKIKTLGQLHEAAVQATGDDWRGDLAAQLRAKFDPKNPWRVGHFDAIVERKGRPHLVVYKLPPGPPGTGGWTSVTEEQARVQAHHDMALAQAMGVKLAGWEMLSLDLGSWALHAAPGTWDSELVQRLTDTGAAQWAGLLAGQPAPHAAPAMPWEENPSAIDWNHLATEFLAYTLLRQGAEAMRTRINDDMEQTITPDRLSPDLEHLALGPAKLRVVRAYQEDRLLETARQLMREAGQDEPSITQVLDNPNLWIPASYDTEALMDLVDMHLGVNIRKDPRFDKAIEKTRQPNVKTLLPLIREMDVNRTVDYASLLDQAKSSVRLEMPSGTVPAPLVQVREHIMGKIGQRLDDLAREVAHEYPAQIKLALEAAPAAVGAARRRRTP